MNQDNIPLAYERLAGQIEKLVWAISTPSITGKGINFIYETTSQEHFFFPCPSCSKFIELDWPQSVVLTAKDENDPKIKDTHLICTLCQATLPHNAKLDFLSKAIWVPGKTGREENRGFYINQLYSAAVTPVELAKKYFEGLKDQTSEQAFFNSNLGKTHEVKGARITDENLKECVGDHVSGPRNSGKLVTMGVDQGKVIHYEISEWTLGAFKGNDINSQSFCRTLAVGEVMNFEDLDDLMAEYYINACVIDAHPERRAAFAFSQRFFGHIRMCFYGNGVNGKALHLADSEVGEPTITVDRTSWMDMALGRFKREKKTISTPQDVPTSWGSHMKTPCRIYKEDVNGNKVGRYVHEEHKADHWAHARTYCEIALALAATQNQHQDIS